MIIEVGRECVKLTGREAGKKCVIVEVVDKNFATVIGKDVKKRRCNIKHLEPLDKKVKIKKGATDKDIIKSLK
jgi:large subunit ribosomal protein L14e